MVSKKPSPDNCLPHLLLLGSGDGPDAAPGLHFERRSRDPLFGGIVEIWQFHCRRPIAYDKFTRSTSRRRFRAAPSAARNAAGITPWPDNAMRHSFVSYRLSATGNAAQTALESGHDQAVLFKHYRELVRPLDAARYWQIFPAAEAGARNVIEIKAA
jgi:hypothetical protein